MTGGMITQATIMKTAQTVSHAQRVRYRMGSVKFPFIRPEATAKAIPQ